MKNLSEMMKQAQAMQERLKEVQEGLESTEISGESGAGLVKMTLNGKGRIVSVSIDPSIVDPEDPTIVEDLIVAAYADAASKVEAYAEEEMSKVTGGISLPPGMKLPF